MEKIIHFIDRKLASATKYPQYAQSFFAHAFGALEYHMLHNPADESDLICLWEEKYYNAFNAIIYGGGEV